MMNTWESNYLAHFGIKGQKWGVRRYQNEDGTLTEEGKRRYLQYVDANGIKVYSHEAGDIYNRAVDQANKGLSAVNKKWDKLRPQGFVGDDRETLMTNLEYTKEVRDMYQKAYRNVLAKDMGADPATLEGQKWLKGVLYYDALDSGVREIEKKLNKKENKTAEQQSKPKESEAKPKAKTNRSINMNPKPLKDYSNSKMSSKVAISKAYDDLEKIYPNFSSLSLDQQDTLWMNYLNSSGLYKWV